MSSEGCQQLVEKYREVKEEWEGYVNGELKTSIDNMSRCCDEFNQTLREILENARDYKATMTRIKEEEEALIGELEQILAQL